MIQGKSVFTCVRMDDFLTALSEKVTAASCVAHPSQARMLSGTVIWSA